MTNTTTAEPSGPDQPTTASDTILLFPIYPSLPFPTPNSALCSLAQNLPATLCATPCVGLHGPLH